VIHCWRLVFILGVSASSLRASPILLITNLPAFQSTALLKGCVLNGDPATEAIAIFIYVPGYGWVNKPGCNPQPQLTPIQSDGSWSASVFSPGTGDTNATRIAALLVSTNYNQPCVLGLPNLPTDVYAQAISKVVVTRSSTGLRFLSFSGYDWWVKTSPGSVGPGPNYFSDATNNVFTDSNGWLHLRITHRTNAWQCAEIISARTFGYGNYRFEVNSPVDNLDPNVTLGLFTWSDDPAFTDREIDVEGGRWQNASDANNAQFVVQPFDGANHLARYRVPAGLADSTHLFVWETNRVSFQSQSNAYSSAATNLISSFVFSTAAEVPQTGDENVHLNLWLVLGTPPSDNNEVEVVIKSFNFVPLGAAQPATLSPARNLPGNPQLTISGTPDWRYDLQVSSDLVLWQDLSSLLASNNVIGFQDTNAAGWNRRFYRTITLP
jgi:hypothetical protein